jgi:putative peptidoglycan lipid II flippase
VATVLAVATFTVLGRDGARLVMLGNPSSHTRALYTVALAMVVGLVPFSAQYLLQRVFYAFEDARTPFLIQVAIVSIWTVGALIAGAALPSDQITVGVGLALSLANLVGAAISLIVLRRRIGSVDGGAMLRSHLRFVAAALGAAAPAWLVSTAVHAVLGDDRLGAVAALLLGGMVMVTMYAGLLKAIHADELDSLLSPLTARLGSNRKGSGRTRRHALR